MSLKMPQLSGLDYVILSVMGLSVITGLFRGFVKELMALGIWVIALWGAARFSGLGADYLKPWVSQTEVRMVASFILITIIILLLGGLITSLLAFVIERSGLSSTDRLLGMIFGFARAVFIISLVILVAQLTGFPTEKYAKDSRLYGEFNPVVEWMASYAPQWLSKMKDLDKTNSSLKLTEEVTIKK
jgi:membrane protein required for colicin V production